MARLSEEVTLTFRESRNGGKIAIITLNRPAKYNALSGAHYRRLARLMSRVDRDDAVVATLWRSTGKFFSAGADVRSAGASQSSQSEADEDDEDTEDEGFYMRQFTGGNLNITHAFFHHRHPLWISLNGPVIGMTAALVAYGDFIVATPTTYLLTPFSSLGLAPEGGSSVMFPLKMGAGLANRALLLSESIGAEELYRAGFVTKMLEHGPDFDESVLRHIQDVMADKNVESMRIAKEHIRDGLRERLESANVKEVYGAIDRFNAGIPQEQFMRLAMKEKRHKL